ncbi:MAG: L-threonylcarbamoyladenylate synthase [Anaerolineales bacterium]
MKTERLSAEAPDSISHAIDVLEHGGVVAFPTDTVYGLGAPAFNRESIERLYSIKGRENAKAIAILISSPDELDRIAENPSEDALHLARRFWPGPLTLVVPRKVDVPEILSHGPTIGVRVPDHEFARQLLAAAGPMAVTSANLSGQANTRNAGEVLLQLEGRIHLVLDGGQTPGDTPSTVVDMTSKNPKILRHGPVTEPEILATLL